MKGQGLLKSTMTTLCEQPTIAHSFFLSPRRTATYFMRKIWWRKNVHNKTMRHLNWLSNQGYLRRHDHGDGYVFNITDTGYLRCRDIPSMDLNTIPYHYQEPTGRQANHELLITKTAATERLVPRQARR